MSRPLLAVDGPFVLYRSFFAMPDSILGVEGRPVGALLGACNLILRIAAETDPRAIVVCFGAEAAAYRVELYPAYHAAREDPPEALAWQFSVAERLFAAFGWTSAADPAVEADDLLHSLALDEVAAGGEGLIMTGDRDMYQCAAEGITVLFLKMGGRGFERVDPAEVRRRYGVAPEQVPDFIALRGDPSDGLPGAPGIGEKTAAALLQEHGSLEGVIAAADLQRPRIAAALRENAAELLAFKKIATLQAVSVKRPADSPTDLAAGAAAARELGMRALAERVGNAVSLAEL
jgi:DNA polymerase-1